MLLTSRLALPLIAIVLTACRPGADTGTDSLAACRVPGVDREIRCGKVEVAEDPAAPAGRRIEVHYAVVPAIARNKQPDPVFVLAGGPGQAASKLAGQLMPLMNALNARRDIVFVDQRGTGRSNPFECAHDEATVQAALQTAQQIARLRECVASFKGDPRHYATWIAVRDFDAVRAQLGAQQINLWGASYGTRAALDYLRQFPDRVRSMVLDGVVPPDMTLPESFSLDSEAALAALARLCDADSRCKQTYPDFEANITALLARATAAQAITVSHPLTGAVEVVPLDTRALASLLRAPLYAPALAAVLPLAVAEASQRNYGPLVTLTFSLAGGLQDNFATGMHFAVICAEDLPRMRSRQKSDSAVPNSSRFGTVFEDFYRQACAVMPSAPVPAAFYELSSGTEQASSAAPPRAVPILMLSGGRDPATPPRHAETVAAKLANVTHLVAPNLAHGVSAQGCAPQLITRFVRAASAAGLDGACLGAIPPPTFHLPLAAQPAQAAAR